MQERAHRLHRSRYGGLAPNDAYARAMEWPEYSGHVQGMGLGPLPVRSSYHPSTSSSRAAQDIALLLSQISALIAQVDNLQQRKREYMETQEEWMFA